MSGIFGGAPERLTSLFTVRKPSCCLSIAANILSEKSLAHDTPRALDPRAKIVHFLIMNVDFQKVRKELQCFECVNLDFIQVQRD